MYIVDSVLSIALSALCILSSRCALKTMDEDNMCAEDQRTSAAKYFNGSRNEQSNQSLADLWGCIWLVMMIARAAAAYFVDFSYPYLVLEV